MYSQLQIPEDLAEVRLFSTGSWAPNGRWCPGAHLSENIKAHLQIDITFINKLHIWSLNKHILT